MSKKFQVVNLAPKWNKVEDPGAFTMLFVYMLDGTRLLIKGGPKAVKAHLSTISQPLVAHRVCFNSKFKPCSFVRFYNLPQPCAAYYAILNRKPHLLIYNKSTGSQPVLNIKLKRIPRCFPEQLRKYCTNTQ